VKAEATHAKWEIPKHPILTPPASPHASPATALDLTLTLKSSKILRPNDPQILTKIPESVQKAQ
jgi:hypothetical protein